MEYLSLNEDCCKHAVAENCTTTGTFCNTPGGIPKCSGQCPTCDGKWHHHFRQVNEKELIKFFESERVRSKGLFPATYDMNGDSLTNLLWNDAKSIHLIFGAKKKTTIKRSMWSL